MSDLKAIELFAGYGGLAMAIEHVTGAKTVAMSEIEPAAIDVLGHRFPDAAALGDVTRIDWHRVDRTIGPIDIVGGGSPCQDLSPAGHQAGMREGTRSGLWFSMLEGIRVLRPRLVVWENVRGALSAEADSNLEPCPWCVGGAGDGEPPMRALGRVVSGLADIGYVGGWVCLQASEVGAPHGRDRVFLCAWPASDPSCLGWEGWSGPAGQADEQGRPGDQGAADRLRSAVADTQGDGRDEGRPEPAGIVGGSDAPVGRVGHLVGCTDWCQRDRDWRIVHGGRVIDFGPAVRRWHDLTRCVPPLLAPGARGGDRLSPELSEWVMGLPAGWVTGVPGISANDMLTMLGNGVLWQQAAVGISEVIGRARLAVAA